ncbi:uncharacterized protein ACLA_080950 [Aspergillus clavatus NRRL 1]|uniref:ATP phosphoribosyltransferase n=1 Tax=Aspergillus clavatus (strain ATCC 1007 / CBS 513.65 / DSM 816 / NCTC 3887 / NRRL 1 / QM 1276 / 107) TaxID=344612 RepID=A1CSX4_ASPCL|nr:uncharacterized protein ACLA_080950 [Aspergillus clavatus NRRL 1]EAW06411.1 conserved hypothetical protein [Aspergillus clavatus NRRL 1]
MNLAKRSARASSPTAASHTVSTHSSQGKQMRLSIARLASLAATRTASPASRGLRSLTLSPHLTTVQPRLNLPSNKTAKPVLSHCYRRIMSTAVTDRYKLIFFVPHSHLEACKEAIFATGAGTFPGGKYSKCAFQTPGTGQFLPAGDANPAIGAVGQLETVEEMKVEVMCLGRSIMLEAVEALKKAHPYEEVAYEVYKMEDV